MIRATSPDRVYGPHDESTAPGTVTVFARRRDGGDHEEPVPEAILHQRRALNERAARRHEATSEA